MKAHSIFKINAFRQLPSYLLVIRVADRSTEVSLKHPLLQVDTSPAHALLLIRPSEVDPLGPLPRLNADKEQNSGNEHDTPLPADSGVLEHNVVDDGDVHDRENGDEPNTDRVEKELVAPDIVEPLGEVLL